MNNYLIHERLLAVPDRFRPHHISMLSTGRRGAVVKGLEHISTQHLSGACSSPAGSTSQDLNSQKLHC